MHDLGFAGAKIDFFDHGAKEDVDLYEALIRKAAEYQMVVDFHGSNKPTGQLRTWPNEMLREGVRGMESSSVKERARHETILAFARYLAGPADYTTPISNTTSHLRRPADCVFLRLTFRVPSGIVKTGAA